MLRSMLINGKKKFYANDCANDLWIREVVFPGKRRGFFVEAGAADGLGGSSCFLLEKKLGWKGICIEPCEEFFHLLSQNRPKSIHVNACLARNAGTVDFVEAPLAGAITPYLSGVRDVLLRYKHEAEIVVEAGKIVPKQSVRLADLLDSHKAPREIEYGAFDIEGSEFEALRDFPFDRYRFLALSFEVDSRIAEPLSALLVQNNYVQTRNPFNQEYPAEQYWLHQSVADKAPAAYKASKLHDFRDSIHNVLESLAGRLSRVTSSKEYIAEIDGLRFIALISVLIFHSTIDFLTQRGWQEFPNYWSFGQGVILRTLGLGWLGVQTFFVISGFVVALPFARYSFASAPEPTLGRYFLRRVTRIEPPYILALIAMYFTFRPLAYYLPHLIAGLFYMHQFVFGTRNPINVVTWSLEVEIFFYILAPWLTRVYLIRKRTDRWMLQLALIACYSYAVEFLLLPHGPHRFRDSVFEFLPYFFAGIFLADLYACGLVRRTGRFAWDLVVAGAAGALFYAATGAWENHWMTPLFLILIFLGAIKGRFANQFVRFRAITIIGGMCYSAYLWHIPMLHLLHKTVFLLIPRTLPNGVGSLLFSVLTVPILVLGTVPIFYFMEKPFMNGPGASYLERVLRSIAGLVQRRPVILMEEAD